jgi:hypothetical protein
MDNENLCKRSEHSRPTQCHKPRYKLPRNEIESVHKRGSELGSAWHGVLKPRHKLQVL